MNESNMREPEVGLEQGSIPRPWRRRMRLPLMIGGPVVAALIALILYLLGGRYEATDDAYVQAASEQFCGVE